MIDLQNLTLKQIFDIKEMFFSSKEHEGKKDICDAWIGRHVIIRTYSAGVHFGVLKAKEKDEVILGEARRIWSWAGAFTLSKIAESGLDSRSRLSVSIPEIKITEIEIIPCSEKCIKSLTELNAYSPKE